ncbi:MAG: DUF2341 domain-containing protein [Opitutales bacterium]|nr:DUF2341 domain-containing protein [Opitutales bacterium]
MNKKTIFQIVLCALLLGLGYYFVQQNGLDSSSDEKLIEQVAHEAPDDNLGDSEIPRSDPDGVPDSSGSGKEESLRDDLVGHDFDRGELPDSFTHRQHRQKRELRERLPIVRSERREDLPTRRELWRDGKVLAVGWSDPDESGRMRRVTLIQPESLPYAVRLEEMVLEDWSGFHQWHQKKTEETIEDFWMQPNPMQPEAIEPEVLLVSEEVADQILIQFDEGMEDAVSRLAEDTGLTIDRKISASGLYRMQLGEVDFDLAPETVDELGSQHWVRQLLRFAETDPIQRTSESLEQDLPLPYSFGGEQPVLYQGGLTMETPESSPSSPEPSPGALYPNDPYYDYTPGMDGIYAPEAWAIRTGAPSIVLAVIDTGVDYMHEDLADNMWVNPDPGSNSFGIADDVHGINAIQMTGDPMDDQSHGTHVAGTAGAVGDNGIGVAGVAWDVQLMALKFISAQGGGRGSDAITCLDYALEHGAHLSNNSWGGGGWSDALYEAIDRQRLGGRIFVAAAGNSSLDASVYLHLPAHYPLNNIISVGATSNGVVGTPAFFTTWGIPVHISAPGTPIYSTDSFRDPPYGHKSGTSMAAPHVAGAVAMVMEHFPELDYMEVRQRILQSGTPYATLSGMNLTASMLNLHRALTVDLEDVLLAALHLPRSEGGAISLTRLYEGGKEYTLAAEVFGKTPDDDVEIEVIVESDFRGETIVETIQLDQYNEDREMWEGSIVFLADPGETYELVMTLNVTVPGYDFFTMDYPARIDSKPVNDTHNNAIQIPEGGGTYIHTNQLATMNDNDPFFMAGIFTYKPLWFRWTPKYDTTVEIHTYGSEWEFDFTDGFGPDPEENGYDTIVGLFAGSYPRDSMIPIAANRFTDEWPEVDGVKRNWSRVVAEVEAGVNYYIVHSGPFSHPGIVHLTLNPHYPAPIIKEEPPAVVTALRGQEITVGATVLWGEQFTWFKDDEIGLPPGVPDDGPSFTIDSASAEDAGLYTLMVANDYGTTQTREVLVRVVDPAGIDEWQAVNPVPTPHGLSASAEGGGESFAVGEHGTLLRREGLFEWSPVDLSHEHAFNDIRWDEDTEQFVLVGDQGTLITGSGDTWTVQDAGVNDNLRSLTKGNGLYVAVGGQNGAGTILTSSDGEIWTERQPAGLVDTLYDVHWNGSLFVAVGGNALEEIGAVWSSPDGEVWSLAMGDLEGLLYDVTYWNGQWVSVGGNYAGAVLLRGSAPDGLQTVETGLSDPLYAVGGNDNRLLIGGEMGVLMESSDAENWAMVESGTIYALKAIDWYGQAFAATGDVGTILHSEDGLAWQGGFGYRASLETLVTHGDQQRIVSAGDLSTSLVSLEGSDWNFWSIGGNGERFFGIDWDGSQFIAVGEFGRLATSAYGQDWDDHPTFVKEHLRGVKSGGGKTVAVGSRGTILLNQGGPNWNQVNSPTSQRLNDVAYAEGFWLAVGREGTILSSTDGAHWLLEDTNLEVDLYSVIHDGNRFVASGDDGWVFHSVDGFSWQGTQLEEVSGLFGLAHGNGQLVAVGEAGKIFSSADANHWKSHSSPVRTTLYDVTYQDGRFILVGSMGTILLANPLPTAETPIFSPEETVHADAVSLTIDSGTTGAVVRYTLDGTVPNEDSPVFTSPVSLEVPTLVRARAYADGYEPSGVAEAQYIIGDAPFVLTHPLNQNAGIGGDVVFSVEVIGEEPFSYVWKKDGDVLEGETGASLQLSDLIADNAGIYTVVVSNNFGSVESEPAELSLWQPPVIVSQPEEIYALFGEPVMFEVAVEGDAPMAYQWRLNKQIIPGATRSQLALPSVSHYEAGDYDVLVSNPGGTVRSQTAPLYVDDSAEAPLIVTDPQDVAGLKGQPVGLTVKASGTRPRTYTWYRGGQPVADGVGLSSLSIPALSSEDAGAYTVTVSNEYGSADSALATVSMLEEGHDLEIILHRPASREVAIVADTGLVLDAEVKAYGEDAGTIFQYWTMVEGPAPIDFADASAASTTTYFAEPGIYTLRLTAADGAGMTEKDLNILVLDQVDYGMDISGHPENFLTIPVADYYQTHSSKTFFENGEGDLEFPGITGGNVQGVVANLPEGNYRLENIGDQIMVEFEVLQHQEPATHAGAAIGWGFFTGSPADQDNWTSVSDWSGYFHRVPVSASSNRRQYRLGSQSPAREVMFHVPFEIASYVSISAHSLTPNTFVPVTLRAERVVWQGEEYIEVSTSYPVPHNNSTNTEGDYWQSDLIWRVNKASGEDEIQTVRSLYPVGTAFKEFSGIGFSNRIADNLDGFQIRNLRVHPVGGGGRYTNLGPLVDTHPREVLTTVNEPFALEGNVSDDGQPEIPGTVETLWQQLGGEPVSLENPYSLTNTYTPTTSGVQHWRLFADDGAITTFNDKQVGVSASGLFPPYFISNPVLTAVEEAPYEYIIDTEGDTSELEASELPEWLQLTDHQDGTGVLSGIPPVGSAGLHVIHLQAGNGTETATQSFTLDVAPAGTVLGAAQISLHPETEVDLTTATLNGELTGGEVPVNVKLWYGLADAGESGELWDHQVTLGERLLTPFSSSIAGLRPGTQYVYRFSAENAAGTVWSELGQFQTAGGPAGLYFDITFPGYEADRAMEDFPLLVRITEEIPHFSYDEMAYPETGADLRFYDEAMNELPFELQQWDPEGESLAWVRIPYLDGASRITMVVGNADQEGFPGYTVDGTVWEGNFKGVWHLHEAGDQARADSTPYAANAVSTGSNAVLQGKGIVGKSAKFDGSGGNTRLALGEDQDQHRFHNRFTVEGWVRLDGDTNNHTNSSYWRLLALDDQYNNGAGYSVSLISSNRFDTSIGVNPGSGGGSGRSVFRTEMDEMFSSVPVDEWVYLSTTWDGFLMRHFINGELIGESGGYETPIAYADSSPGLFLGATDNRSFPGFIDEVRISENPKSADWVLTTYLNIAQTGLFQQIDPYLPSMNRPIIVSSPPSQVIVPDTYTYNVQLSSSTMEGLLLEAPEGLPAWLTLSATADPLVYQLTGTPSENDVGTEPITLEVSNVEGASTQAFFLHVHPEGTIPGLAAIELREIGDVTAFTAQLHAELISGDTPIDLELWYGTGDGGDDREAWMYHIDLGSRDEHGSLTRQLTSLHNETTYFYRFGAINHAGTASTETGNFTTLSAPQYEVRIDFGSAEGMAELPWYAISSSGTHEDLPDFHTGEGTGFSVSFSGGNSGIQDSNNSGLWGTREVSPDWASAEVLSDRMWVSNGRHTSLTIGGLLPGGVYSVELASSVDANTPGGAGDYELQGEGGDLVEAINGADAESLGTTVTWSARGPNDSPSHPDYAAEGWLVWPMAVADENGELVLTIQTPHGSNSRGALNAMRIATGGQGGPPLTPFEEWLARHDLDHLDPDEDHVLKGGREVALREAYLLGEDPHNPSDLVRIIDILPNEAENTMRLYFPSLPDRFYTVEVSEDLTEGSWAREGEESLTGDGETRYFTVPMDTTDFPRRFYRIKVSFPD